MLKCTEIDVFKTFEEIEKYTKPSIKIKLLEKLKNCEIAIEIFIMVEDPHIVFHVGKETLNKIPCGLKYKTNFNEFMKLADKLKTGELRGNKLIKELTDFFKKTDKFTCKWYKRILLKSLKIGVGESMLSLVYGDKIPIFKTDIKNLKPQLGYEFFSYFNKSNKDVLKHFKKCNVWYVEPKYDGIRALAVFLPNDDIKVLSRNSKELPNAKLLFLDDLEIVKKKFRKIFPDGFVIDGEIYGKNWNETMRALFNVKSKNFNVLNYKGKIKYYVWDVVDLKVMLTGGSSQPYSYRKKIVDRISKIKDVKNIIPVKHQELIPGNFKRSEELLKFISDKIDEYIKKGYEGIMLKCADAPYQTTRTSFWIKGKKLHTDDFLVIDVDKKSEKPGMIGALIIDVDGVKTRVGSGLTDAQRRCFYKHPEDIIGEYVEVIYQEKTKDGRLRFPRLYRIRLDKSPNKNKKYHCLKDVI